MKTRAFFLALLLIGCAGPDSTGASTQLGETGEDEVGATRASREAAAAESVAAESVAAESVAAESVAAEPTEIVAVEEPSATVLAPPSSSPPAAGSRPPFVARVITASEGENGRGEIVPAVSPIAFDLDARPWPVRALDPVLLIGELRFRDYEYPSPGLLRFIAADRAALPEGAEVAMQWGDDARTRQVLAPALELP